MEHIWNCVLNIFCALLQYSYGNDVFADHLVILIVSSQWPLFDCDFSELYFFFCV